MHRTVFDAVLSLCAVPAALIAPAGQACAQAPSRPNIVMIMVDDAGVGDFTSYNARTPVLTPNINALVASGLRFTQAYAGSTVCAPSRSALMTGQHMGHTPIRDNFNTSHLLDREVTLAEVLKTAGYATGGFGKWGLGAPGTTGAPERQGFDEFLGFYHQVHAHSHYADRLYLNGRTYLIPENVGFNEPATGLVADARGHQQNVIFARMQQFIADQAARDVPFFAYGTWTLPHVKSTLPQAEAEPGGAYAPYADKPWNAETNIQAAFMTWIDRQVGQLVTQLSDPNGDGDTSDSITANTLLLFASDNGGAQGGIETSAWDRNTETVDGAQVILRGDKGSLYEGGLRVPLVASWPGHVAAGESDLLTYFPDLMPTFAELADATGAVPGETDGISIVPTLLGDGPQASHEVIYFEKPASTNPLGPVQQAVRRGDWKLIRETSGAVKLYDLATDPSETTNVAGGRPSVVATLTAAMDANHEMMRPQYNVSPPTVGNASKDGIVAFGIRPGVVANRNWTVNASGDAKSLSGLVRNEAGDAVGMYLNDLEPDYELTLSVDRPGEASPELLVELLGESGFVYFTAGYDMANQAAGVTADVTVDLALTRATPAEAVLRGDLNSPLTLRISHAGGHGEGFVDGIHFALGPAFADLNLDGAVDLLDWEIERDNMFADLAGMPLDEAYWLGDLNGDSRNNELDFGLFKAAFDAAHRTGAFDEMLARVPEPATERLALVGAAMALCLVRSVRNRPQLVRSPNPVSANKVTV